MLDSSMVAVWSSSRELDESFLVMSPPPAPVNHARIGLRPGDAREEGDAVPPKRDMTGELEVRGRGPDDGGAESRIEPRTVQHFRNRRSVMA